MERYEYKKCFFPSCKNDSKNTSKAIVKIREDLREKWCREANVEYFKVYNQYCCEDHFDPEKDLINPSYKCENKEPRFKPTAQLKNNVNNLTGMDVSMISQPQETELSKLLLQPTNIQAKKTKYVATDMPSTSGAITSASFKAPDSSIENEWTTTDSHQLSVSVKTEITDNSQETDPLSDYSVNVYDSDESGGLPGPADVKPEQTLDIEAEREPADSSHTQLLQAILASVSHQARVAERAARAQEAQAHALNRIALLLEQLKGDISLPR